MAEEKIQTSGGTIKMLNTVAPILLVLMLGVIQFVWRKKRWTTKHA
jgi:hypothetical protein